jgi:3-hydroxybutyryl-CoA dehydratase
MMPRAYFDDLEPGQLWGTSEWKATPEACTAWQQATGDDCPIYHDTETTRASSYGGPIVPPGLAFVYLSDCIQDLLRDKPPGGIHARQQLKFHQPVRPGDVLTTSLSVRDKYLKRGRKYVEFETQTVNQAGQTVLTGLRTSIWAE